MNCFSGNLVYIEKNVENFSACQATLDEFSQAVGSVYFLYDKTTQECKLFDSDVRDCSGMSGPRGNLTKSCIEDENDEKSSGSKGSFQIKILLSFVICILLK